MDCILKRCAHSSADITRDRGPCLALEECGAGYVLARAAQPGGYQVRGGVNPTVSALIRAGRLQNTGYDGTAITVVAVASDGKKRSAGK